VVGDLEVDAIMPLVEEYLGDLEPQGRSRRVRTEEPSPEYYRRTVGPDFDPPYVEKRVNGRAATTPSVEVRFHIPPLWHDDLAPLYMLGQVMSSRTGAMYTDMVLENEHATRVSARASTSMYDGSFSMSASIKEVRNRMVVPPEQIERELWEFIEQAKSQPCESDLLQKVKNQVEASFLRSLSGTGIAGSLARMETAYEWEFLEEQYQQRMAVTPEDLMRVAQKYLNRGNSVTGILERER